MAYVEIEDIALLLAVTCTDTCAQRTFRWLGPEVLLCVELLGDHLPRGRDKLRCGNGRDGTAAVLK
jgi:hypothetical protein